MRRRSSGDRREEGWDGGHRPWPARWVPKAPAGRFDGYSDQAPAPRFTRYAFVNRCTKLYLRRSVPQGSTQPVLAHPPEVVLHAIDQRHRDLVPVLGHVLAGRRDVTFLPPDPEIRGDPGDHRPRLLAQVAARLAEERDPGGAARRLVFRRPVRAGAITFRHARQIPPSWRGGTGGGSCSRPCLSPAAGPRATSS